MTVRAPGPRGRPEDGFVLIGVVIFVLALTIIGLSLFSLSSYEAQFLQRSLDGEEAFQSAVGGIERARFVLQLWGSHLQDVKDDAPPGTSAVAWQAEGGVIDSVGPVDWDPTNPVFIRVTAESGISRRAVEAWFTPLSSPDYYRQVVTTCGGIEVRDVGIPAPVPLSSDRAYTVLLDGTVWEASGQDTTTWKQWLAAPQPTPVQTTPSVPVPDAADFIAMHRNTTEPDTSHSGDPSGTYVAYFRLGALTGGGGQPQYVTSDAPIGTSPTWSLYEGMNVDANFIQVSGCVVWLFPRGVWFYQTTEITGVGPAGTNCLVIVAGMNGPVPNTEFSAYDTDSIGIWFSGGLRADIPVILVSDGKVVLWHYNDPAGLSYAHQLSIFAESVSLMGPTSPYTQLRHMELHHPAQGPLDNHFLPMLQGNGALPNVTSTSGYRLALVSGTWRASTP